MTPVCDIPGCTTLNHLNLLDIFLGIGTPNSRTILLQWSYQTLENVQSAKYLGITITDNMDWGQHVSEISSKATKTLGFLRRNLAFAPSSTKEVAYKALVRPKLEYAAPIWSPHSKLQINQI